MNGNRITIARQRRGLSRPELAEILGVTARAVGGWETGSIVIPKDRESEIARELGFPDSFFKLKDSASVQTGAVSFRSLSRKTAAQRDAALAMCDLSIELAAWLDPRFGRDKVSLPDLSDEAPDLAADLLRREWGLGHQPIKHLINLLEAKGVRLFALPENCREIDACSFWMDDKPYILIDTSRSSERMRFNIAHELGHLVMHRHGAPTGQEAEKDANSFASSFLITIQSIHRNIPKSITLESIINSKKIWGVSAAALAYRLNKLKYLSDWHYKSIVIEMRRRDFHVREPNAIPCEQSYVLDLVLKALRERGITLRHVASEIHLPMSEVVGLLQGLAVVEISKHEIATPAERRASLRVVT